MLIHSIIYGKSVFSFVKNTALTLFRTLFHYTAVIGIVLILFNCLATIRSDVFFGVRLAGRALFCFEKGLLCERKYRAVPLVKGGYVRGIYQLFERSEIPSAIR